jgi:hypothetical protein
MNRYQRAILLKFASVLFITVIAVAGMIQFKNWVNRSEGMRAMEHLSRIVLQYRKEHSSLPPQSYVDDIMANIEGNVRLGKLIYRAQWIDFDATGDEILAYAKRRGSIFLFGSGFIVLRLDGRVEWIEEKKFKRLLAKQQGPIETQMSK